MLTLQTTHENAYTFPQTCFLQHDSAHILRNRAIQAVGLQPNSSAAAVVNEFGDEVMRIDAGEKCSNILIALLISFK